MDLEKIKKEIDKMHQFSNDALERKSFDSYINILSDNLKYKQFNGRTIDKKQLTKDTARYFSRLKNFENLYQRKDYRIEENRFIEILNQKVTASIKVFFFFTKKWTVERNGIYEWVNIEGDWKIDKVEILSENVY